MHYIMQTITIKHAVLLTVVVVRPAVHTGSLPTKLPSLSGRQRSAWLTHWKRSSMLQATEMSAWLTHWKRSSMLQATEMSARCQHGLPTGRGAACCRRPKCQRGVSVAYPLEEEQHAAGDGDVSEVSAWLTHWKRSSMLQATEMSASEMRSPTR